LTERLAVVDRFAFPDVNALREHLVTIVQDHLRGRDESRRVEFDGPFTSSGRTSSRCRSS